MKKDINLLTEIQKMKNLMNYMDDKQIIKEELDINKINNISVDEFISAKKEADFEYPEIIRILIKKLYPEVEDLILNRLITGIDEDEIGKGLKYEMDKLMDVFNNPETRVPWDKQKPYVDEMQTKYYKNYILNFVKNNRLV
jgi:hypothetical protein